MRWWKLGCRPKWFSVSTGGRSALVVAVGRRLAAAGKPILLTHFLRYRRSQRPRRPECADWIGGDAVGESVRHGGTQCPVLHYGTECGGEIGLRWFLQAVVAAYINYPARKFRAGFLHVSYGQSGISAYSFLVTSLLGIPQASASRSLMYSLITPSEIDIQALAKFSGCSSNSSSIHCAKRSA